MKKRRLGLLLAVMIPLLAVATMAYRYVRDYDFSLPGPLQGLYPIEEMQG